MAGKLKDRQGDRHGRLIVVEYSHLVGTTHFWLCLCDCGNTKVVTQKNLASGHTISCGCYSAEATRNRRLKHGHSVDNGTPEFHSWLGILQRCNNPRSPAYERYGGRGIKVCERWQKFENFLEDVGRRPSSGHSIDRRDNDGDYCPENCRWATRIEQSNNTRRNILLTAHGKTQTLKQWSVELGINYGTLWSRHDAGKPAEEVLRR